MIDIHPEDLLDREREGVLSAEEGVYLAAHLERCAACRIERLLAQECATERDFIDAELSRLRPNLEETLRGVGPLDNPPLEPRVGVERRTPSRPPRSAIHLRRAVPRAGVVVGALLLAGGAAALGGGLPWSASATAPAAASIGDAPRPAPSSTPTHRARPARSSALPARSSDTEVDEVHGAAPVESSAPAVVLSAAPSAPSPSATQLFSDAATARRDGNYERALLLYNRLIARFPKSPEAQTAQAVRARLLLDLGRAHAAEKGFRQAAKSEGPLSEVALVGQAQALRRAGKLDAERGVWRELLRRFPGSPQAVVAQARLRELGAD